MMALTMFTDNHAGGTYYVAGSAQTYSNTLEKAIEKYGGTMLYNKTVKEILFQGERACGVRLSDGIVLEADRIVSDTTVWNLYFDLIPQEKVTEKQRQWANSLVPTYPAMVLYLIVSKTVFQNDLNAVEYFISDTSKIEMGDITLYIPTIDDHTLGPEDEHIITVFSPAPNQKWPRPFESAYKSPDYVEQKQRQAELILSEIENTFPGFRKGIKKMFIATPSTIERYTLKTWGCVGGPKQMMGQELTKRLHAKTEWPGLYACGDSTTMGMGTPAVVASGFGAANIILRELKKPEYHHETFQKEYVHYIQTNPKLSVPDSIENNPQNASILARECQYCENPVCVSSCPAGIDIPGYLRRIEAGNYAGAARLIREKNPFAEICGYVCPVSEFCENVCFRTSFAEKPVLIRELHRWVAEYAGLGGWSPAVASTNGKSIVIVGAGATGLTCAYYLSRLGYSIDLFDAVSTPGGSLLSLAEKGLVPKAVLDRELAGIMLPGIRFQGDWAFTDQTQLKELQKKYDAVFLTKNIGLKIVNNRFVDGMPNVFVGGSDYTDKTTRYEIVHAVHDGREAARVIHGFLQNNYVEQL